MSDDMSMVSPSSAGEHGVLRSMQEVAMSSEASKMLRTYNIAGGAITIMTSTNWATSAFARIRTSRKRALTSRN